MSADGLDRSSLMFLIRALYRKGFSEIRVNHKNPHVYHHRGDKPYRVSEVIAEESQRLIGLEIESHSTNAITLKQLAEPSEDELKPSVRRLFFLLKGTFADMHISLKSNDFASLQSIEEKHDAITKLISFIIRILNVNSTRDHNSQYLIHILMSVDVLVDMLKYFARMAKNADTLFEKQDIRQFELLQELHTLFDQLYFAWDNKLANTFHEKRSALKKDLLVCSSKNAYLLYYLLPIVELYRDLLEAKLCMV